MQLRAKLARLEATLNNVGNAISFEQTKDGYLQNATAALTRMGELAMMAQDVTKTDSDRALYQQEYSSLGTFISNVATRDFNGVSLFSVVNKYVTIDPEVQTNGYNTFTIITPDLVGATMTSAISGSITTAVGASTALADVKTALNFVASSRALVGANLEVMLFHQNQLESLKDNLSAANSRIVDVNVAEESTRFAKFNILVQSGTAMLAQANTQPQAVLKLLGG